MQELMKKIVYAIAALALIFTGCAKELDNSTKDNFSKVRLHVKVADQLTKVSADNDGRYHWQAGDEITVFNHIDKPFTFSTEQGGSEVNFGATSWSGNLGKYAMYPASDDHFVDVDEILFNLPSSYSWSANTTNMPMLGKINEDVATFKAVGGVLKLVCYNVPADAVMMEFSATNKQISGDFEIANGAVETPAPSIVTDAKASSNNLVSFDFTGHREDNMVFYIPLPTGTIDGFTVSFLSDVPEVLFTKTSTKNLSVSRNQLIVAPALNCDSAEDAILTNDELVSKAAADSWSAYKSGSITNSYGTWSYYAAYQGNYGGDGKYYIQIANGRDPVSYIKLPSFAKNIGQIILHSVTNAKNEKYTGSIYFASESTEPVTAIATAPVASSAKEDLAIDIPSGYTTGYLKATTACRIAEITVKFRSGYDEPSISPAHNPIIIAVSSGDVNSASTTVTYSTSLTDDLGVSIASHSDWITPTLAGTGPYTLTVSANKKVTAGDREDGFVTLRASGVTKTITVTQPSAYVPDPELTVVPGNGHFTATWTKHANATGYVIYLGDPENGGTNISDDAGLTYDSGTNEYTLTKSVVNDDYDLYVSATPAANYVGQEGYSHESFTCSATSYTVTITQPASGGSFTANGESVTFTASQGDVITLEATPESSSYKFVSWTVTGASPASTTNASTTFTMPAANVTVTASFAAKEWVLVTDASSLSAGDIVAFGAYNISHKISGTTYTKYMVAGSFSSNIYNGVDATFNGDGTKITNFPASGTRFTLGGDSSDGWTFKDGDKYINVGSGSGKVALSADPITWSISITVAGAATISKDTYTWQFNPTAAAAGRFCPYTSSQKEMRLYRYE